MKPVQIAVCHRDSVYAEALAGGLAERWRKAQVLVTSPECQDLPEGVDFILCGDRDRAQKYGARGIHLYDDPEDRDNGIPSIQRFQPLRRIVAQIRMLTERTEGPIPASGDPADAVFWGFTSGVGGSGTTSLAVAAGRILSRLLETQVLLASFDRFASESDFRFEPGSLSVGQCLYRITGEDPIPGNMFPGCLQKDAYDLRRLGGAGEENPLCFAGEEDLYRLFRHIASCGSFRHVLLDIPSGISSWKSLMRMCERQIVNFGWRACRHGPSAALEDALRELSEGDGIDPERRIFPFRPLEDPDSFLRDPGGIDVDIHGQFGSEVRSLVDRMENP